MGKRIVICSDGTGNSAIKGRGTNVFKLFEAVDLDGHRADPSKTPQVAIYDDGVGTQTFTPLKVLAGATGWGLSRNVKHLYKELSRIYDPGDEIFMFGFSRGAFTVRTLAGFIAACGLINPSRLQQKTFKGLERAVDEAYHAYRKCYRPGLWKLFGDPKLDAAREFRKRVSFDIDVKIRFLGVWDTVDAVGLPFWIGDFINLTLYRFKFPDLRLTPIVERACQALAIDDERESFHPLLWEQEPDDASRIEQVWFAGAHSNVGGGYPKQGMSLVALDWMLAHAQRAGMHVGKDGLRLNDADRESFRSHASVDDKLYDPRAGLGAFYRWKIRDIAALCTRHHVPVKVHLSVLERIAHGTDDYAPGNIPGTAEVVVTDTADTNKAPQLMRSHATTLLRLRAENSQEVLRTLPAGALLGKVGRSLAIGQLSYYLYLVGLLVAVVDGGNLLLSWWRGEGFSSAASVVGAAAWGSAAVAVVAAFVLSWRVDEHLSDVFSGAWYRKHEDLRTALKGARIQANASSPAPAAAPAPRAVVSDVA
jgi:uncharacterized protein (DUF2235 family)